MRISYDWIYHSFKDLAFLKITEGRFQKTFASSKVIKTWENKRDFAVDIKKVCSGRKSHRIGSHHFSWLLQNRVISLLIALTYITDLSMTLTDGQIGGIVFAAVLLLICCLIENCKKVKRQVARDQGWAEMRHTLFIVGQIRTSSPYVRLALDGNKLRRTIINKMKLILIVAMAKIR